MNNRGFVKIVLIIISILLLIVIGGAYYAYNFHVYKTIRICIGSEMNTSFSCSSLDDCKGYLEAFSGKSFEIDERLNTAPVFIQEKAREIIDKSFYCDNFCFLREIRGINFNDFSIEFLERCEIDEEEILIEIRGKEGLELADYIKKNF